MPVRNRTWLWRVNDKHRIQQIKAKNVGSLQFASYLFLCKRLSWNPSSCKGLSCSETPSVSCLIRVLWKYECETWSHLREKSTWENVGTWERERKQQENGVKKILMISTATFSRAWPIENLAVYEINTRNTITRRLRDNRLRSIGSILEIFDKTL